MLVSISGMKSSEKGSFRLIGLDFFTRCKGVSGFGDMGSGPGPGVEGPNCGFQTGARGWPEEGAVVDG